MSPRMKLIVALVAGTAAGVAARAFGFTDILVNTAAAITVAILFWGGFWWVGKKPPG